MEHALRAACERAIEFRRSLPNRPVRAQASLEDLRRTLGTALPLAGEDPVRVIEDLVKHAEPGILAEPGPRYFGFVIGGSSEVAVAADWLTSAWDQNAGLYATSPALAVVEETSARWVLDLLELPPDSGVGFVTGCQMAHFTCLAAARGELLRRSGWNVEEDGLMGAPPLTVVVGEEGHITVLRALRFLGMGSARVKVVPADEQGRMLAGDLRNTLSGIAGEIIVCAQAGNLNSGAVDPMAEIADQCQARGAWLHVDGAFGLWANASPSLRPLLEGVARADSWATDAHKWLNVPYDSGIAIVKDAKAHRAAMTTKAAYLIQQQGEARDAVDWVPEFSRRARGFPLYSQLRTLGRQGVAEVIDRSCALARQARDRMTAIPGATILNDVVLNQVLVRFTPLRGGEADTFTRQVIQRVQQDGTCWLSGSIWKGQVVMRFSVCGIDTTEADIDRSIAAIAKAVQTS
jgi:glutamate/tyrosine decarboxylase-like PLP-dependent enzyme